MSMSTIFDTSVYIATRCNSYEAFAGEVETESKRSRYIKNKIMSTSFDGGF